MKEKTDGITKDQEEYMRWQPHLIDKEGDYVCCTCRKVWIPTDEDISRKRPSTYFKGCRPCRLKSFIKANEYKKIKGNNYNKLYDSLIVKQN